MDLYGQLQECVGEFTDGFRTKREYRVLVGACLENRSESIQHSALIHQLVVHSHQPKSKMEDGSGDPNKPGSKPPAPLDTLALLDVIRDTCDYYRSLAGVSPTFSAYIPGLRGMVAAAEVYDDDTLRACLRDFRWLSRRARILLGYEAPTRLIEGHVCGECGGAIRVAVDWSTDPRCAGSPLSSPCGTVYPRWKLAMDYIEGLT